MALQKNNTTHHILGATFYLLSQKAIFWPKHQLLMLGDIHFGKIQHFRKGGIAVPQQAAFNNYQQLTQLITAYQPKQLLFLGDLFHSTKNTDWNTFEHFIGNYPNIECHLVLGNHDILSATNYQQLGLKVHTELCIGNFLFTHEPMLSNNIPTAYYNIAAHVHPCVYLTGAAKQRMRLPCFYFSKQQAILPAFGTFTGMHALPINKTDTIFVVANQSVIRMQ